MPHDEGLFAKGPSDTIKLPHDNDLAKALRATLDENAELKKRNLALREKLKEIQFVARTIVLECKGILLPNYIDLPYKK